jgi:serine/threonine protein kinase/Flp pilus assembly protein TadD
MRNAPRICRKCGAEIFADAPEGLCTACLFETGLSLLANDGQPICEGGSASPKTIHAFGERVSPQKKESIPQNPFANFGDYELLEVIGRGGQGVVYRARQKSLNRTVALKVIGLGHWATDAHLKRFRRKAEAAASLDHSGIVPIYEVGERDGSCYFSMKLVEGGQLDDVSNRDPLPIRRAVELIAKIARTVHYAHEHGILHRDIKPGNILLDQKGEPHLTDFGLARLVETESTVTRTMEVLGTPSYMAPEQALGSNNAISSVTDVYGLGAVLYQLLTGHPPFAGGTTYETIKLLLDTEPRQPRLWNSKIDRDLSTICLKCLEKDPKCRYSSALAEDLECWLKHEPILARRTGPLMRGVKWVRRNPTIAVMAAMLLAFAAPLGVMIWKSESVRPPPATGIAVLPFKNLTEDNEDAYFADGIQDEILTRLSKIADLKVISRTSTQHYKSAPENVSEIGKQLGVAHILEGSVQKSGDAVRVNVQLIKTANDSHLWADTFDRKLTDIFSVESEVAGAIADQLNAKLSGNEKREFGVRPTKNPEAYDAYLRGLAFEGFEASRPKSIEAFENAVRLDPEFAVAWAHLCRQNGIAVLTDFDHAPQRRQAARKDLDMAMKFGPHLLETQLANGCYKYFVERDYEGAKTQLEAIRRQYPNNAAAAEWLGAILRRQGQWEKSSAFYAQALELDPQNLFLLTDAAFTESSMRNTAAAQKYLGRARDLSPQNSTVIGFLAKSFQQTGDIAQAQAVLDSIQPKRGDSIYISAAVTNAIFLRKYDFALAMLKARLENPAALGGALGGVENALGDVQRHVGNATEATAAYQKARQVLNELLRAQPNNAGCMAELAWAETWLEDKDAALRHAQQAVASMPASKDAVEGPSNEDNLACIEAHFGEKDKAIAALEHLLTIPYAFPETPALLRLDPDWDSLRGDPRFQKLVASLGPK